MGIAGDMACILQCGAAGGGGGGALAPGPAVYGGWQAIMAVPSSGGGLQLTASELQAFGVDAMGLGSSGFPLSALAAGQTVDLFQPGPWAGAPPTTTRLIVSGPGVNTNQVWHVPVDHVVSGPALEPAVGVSVTAYTPPGDTVVINGVMRLLGAGVWFTSAVPASTGDGLAVIGVNEVRLSQNSADGRDTAALLAVPRVAVDSLMIGTGQGWVRQKVDTLTLVGNEYVITGPQASGAYGNGAETGVVLPSGLTVSAFSIQW